VRHETFEEWAVPGTWPALTAGSGAVLPADRRGRCIGVSGTQSILDIVDVIPAGSADELARIMLLTGDEVAAAFGTRRPTKE